MLNYVVSFFLLKTPICLHYRLGNQDQSACYFLPQMEWTIVFRKKKPNANPIFRYIHSR
jgi:hypothetical protein